MGRRTLRGGAPDLLREHRREPAADARFALDRFGRDAPAPLRPVVQLFRGECYEAEEVRNADGELIGWWADPHGC